MTLPNVEITPEDYAEINRAARAISARANWLRPIFAILAACILGIIAMPIVQQYVYGGPVNVCSTTLNALPWLLVSAFLYYSIFRPRGPATMTVMPPPPATSPGTVIITILVPLLVLGGFIANGILIPPDPPPPDPPPDPPAGRINPLLALFPWFVIFAAVWITVYRLLKGANTYTWQRQPELHRPQTIHIEPDAITFEDPLSRRRYAWPAFVGFQETQSLFILYHSPFVFSVIPKRAFPDPNIIDHFRGLLVATIQPTPAASPPPSLPKPAPITTRLEERQPTDP